MVVPPSVQLGRWSLHLIICSLFLLVISTQATEEASSSIQEIERASNESLLWGPYRPNLYFGVRPRIPKSFMAGLLWSRADSYQSVQNSRFTLFRREFLAGEMKLHAVAPGGPPEGHSEEGLNS